MTSIQLSQIHVYPLKSGGSISCDSAAVHRQGLQYDRSWALFDASGRLITGREYPQLLDLQTQIHKDQLKISHCGNVEITIPLKYQGQAVTDLSFFSRTVDGVLLHEDIHKWFSDYLGIPCRLFFQNEQVPRFVLHKHGGRENDEVSFADQCPLLLISMASLVDLNTRLDRPIGMQNFRPNLVVDGCQAYAEDQWNVIRIGDVEFEVAQACERCVFTTIDPVTKKKGKEPLKTLATYRRSPNGAVTFGVHLIPRRLGSIKLSDKISINQ